ncbi:MAG: 3-beta hydroxysteroid dehydrogenase, partial [Sandaracinaceae bacterium]
TTHVSNLADALALTLVRGKGGHAYFVADDGTRTLREFLEPLARTGGADLSKARAIPSWLARPLAATVEGAYRLVGTKRTPPMTRFAIDMMSATVTVNDARAREELGYRPALSVEEGMRALHA